MKRRKAFNCLFQKSGETYRLYVNDSIYRGKDWDGNYSETSANYFAEKLAEIPEGSTLEVHINSEGGDAFEGMAIHNLLKAAPVHKIGIVDGRAFSAATYVLMACDERVMNEGTLLLVHNAWTWAIGNADELRAVAEDLDKLMEAHRKVLMQHCSMSEEDLIDLMKEDRFMDAKEALKYGFIDRIGEKAEDPEGDPEEDPEGDPAEDPDDPDEDQDPPAAIRTDRYEAAERFFKQYF